MIGSGDVQAYIVAQSPEFAAALSHLRARLCAILPDHHECMSYAMPGLRQPHRAGKMVIGYGAFSRHVGIYPHSGNVIEKIDCTPYKTSKSGLTFAPDSPPPDHLLRAIITARLAELAGIGDAC